MATFYSCRLFTFRIVCQTKYLMNGLKMESIENIVTVFNFFRKRTSHWIQLKQENRNFISWVIALDLSYANKCLCVSSKECVNNTRLIKCTKQTFCLFLCKWQKEFRTPWVLLLFAMITLQNAFALNMWCINYKSYVIANGHCFAQDKHNKMSLRI